MSLADLIAEAGDNGAAVADLFTYLSARGFSDAEIERAARERTITSLELDRALRIGGRTIDETAADANTTVAEVRRIYRLLGISSLADAGAVADLPGFAPSEARLVELALVADGLMPPGVTDEILRVIGSSFSTIAETIVSAYVGSVEDLFDDRPPREKAEATMAAGSLSLELATLLGPILRHQLWLATLRQRAAMAEAADRRQSTLAVGFVDLVGFTASSEAMPNDELLEFIRGFTGTTFDIVSDHGGRVVKHVGDEIMFTSHAAADACRIAHDLVANFHEVGAGGRAGLAYGVMLQRHGDVYGSVVNRAARLADIAVPGEVLADENVGEQLTGDDAFSVESAGRRQLKGFSSPTKVVSIERRSADIST